MMSAFSFQYPDKHDLRQLLVYEKYIIFAKF